MQLRKAAVILSAALLALTLAGCASGPKVNVVTLEDKGTGMNISTPEWVKLFMTGRISGVQALPEYKDKYCVIGQETGVNKQFVLAWADSFSAQQQIGAMLRTSIQSAYTAKVDGQAQSSGGANSSIAAGAGSGSYQQSIENSINALVNVNYSGAQREGDWWLLQRRYDPDQKDVYSDEYTAFVLYTIPKALLNQQVASSLIANASLDPSLAEMSKEIAEDILRGALGLIE
ncbi:hypothetical protein FACS189485_17340 [Spirochaetia bacterium]|nr:hypothetical protein FACS189485_17340 [Spirochaetia bacterium]